MVHDIREMRSDFTSMGFLRVSRSCNGVADLMAKLNSSNALPQNWTVTPPSAILSLLQSKSSCHNDGG